MIAETANDDVFGPTRASLDGFTPPVSLLSLFASLLMLGQGGQISALPSLLVCAGALVGLGYLKYVQRRAGTPTLPGSRQIQSEAAASAIAQPAGLTGARVLYLVSKRSDTTRRSAEHGPAPLQRLAQAQGDQRFLLDCRRNVSTRWLHLLEEIEAAWQRGRIGEMRWPLYQLRMQTALWGAASTSRQAREFERLIGSHRMPGFEYRCGRSLASLRAALEGRPVGN